MLYSTKNNRFFFTLATTSLITITVHAGSMASTPLCGQTDTPFVSIEGGYTEAAFGSISRNNVTSSNNHGNGAARIAGGRVHPYTTKIDFSEEMGWGYYGQHSSQNNLITGVDYSDVIYGFDLLMGVVYHYNPQVSFFGKAGAMLELVNSSMNVDLSKAFPGGLYSGFTKTRSSNAAPLPELKAGGTYQWSEHVGVFASYMYAFGSKVQGSINHTASPGSITTYRSLNSQIPSLDFVMLGLNYNFT